MSQEWIAFLKKDEALSNWPVIECLLHSAIEKGGGDITTDQLLQLVNEQKVFILAMGEGKHVMLAAALEPIHLYNRNVLHIMFMGGEAGWAKKLGRNFHVVTGFAKAIGCSHIQIGCGPAEARLFRRLVPEFQPYCELLRLEVHE